MKQTVFVVEDDADIARLIKHYLEQAGFLVRTFPRADKVSASAEQNPPSLFLLDIMLPGGDGIDLGRRIRQVPSLRMTPVIFVTAKSSESDRLTGFDVGADDYISKPFNPKELVARVKAVLRRFERPLVPSVLKFDEVEVNTGAMTLFVAGKQVPTTATEFRLLEFLVRNAGKVHRRDQILDAVWRDTDFVTQRSVDVYVRKLREKIERDPENPRRLLTVRGAGYRFEADR